MAFFGACACLGLPASAVSAADADAVFAGAYTSVPTPTTDWLSGVAVSAVPTNAYDSVVTVADCARDAEPSSASGERERTGILAYGNSAHFADTAQLTAAPVTGPPPGAIPAYDDTTATAFFAVFELTVAPKSTTKLFRAVEPGEYYDVISTGNFRTKSVVVDGVEYSGASMPKQFGLNLNEVVDLADTPALSRTAAVIETEIPSSLLKQLDLTPVDQSILRSGSVTVQPEMLDTFNKLKSTPKQAF